MFKGLKDERFQGKTTRFSRKPLLNAKSHKETQENVLRHLSYSHHLFPETTDFMHFCHYFATKIISDPMGFPLDVQQRKGHPRQGLKYAVNALSKLQ